MARLPLFAGLLGMALALTMRADMRLVPDGAFAGAQLTGPPRTALGAIALADGSILAAGGFSFLGGEPVSPPLLLDRRGKQIASGVGAAVPGLTEAAASGAIVWAPLGTAGALVAVPASGPRPLQLARIYSDGSSSVLSGSTPTGTASDGPFINLLVPLPDGSAMACGQFTAVGGHTTLNVARIRPDGSVDPNYTCTSALEPPFGVARDGAVAGTLRSEFGTVGRVDPTGTLTDTWNLDAGNAADLVIASDGAVFAAAEGLTVFNSASTIPQTLLPIAYWPILPLVTIYRLAPGSSVVAIWNQKTTPSLNVSQMIPMPDGGLILIGASSGLVRLKASGDVDVTFAPADLQTFRVGRLTEVASGWFADLDALPSGASEARVLRRLNPDLSIDTTFLPDLTTPVVPTASYLLPDRSVLLAGRFENPSGGTQSLVRLFPDGALDYRRVPNVVVDGQTSAVVAAIGPDGSIYFVGQPVINAGGEAVLIPEPTAGILSTGYVERYSIDGVFDPQFGLQGIPKGTVNCVVADSDGVLLAGSTTANGAATAAAVRVYDPVGLFRLATLPGMQSINSAVSMASGGYSITGTNGVYCRITRSGTLGAAPLSTYSVKGLSGVATAGGRAFLEGSLSVVLDHPATALQRLNDDGSPDPTWHSELGAGTAFWASPTESVSALADGRIFLRGSLRDPTGAVATSALLAGGGNWDIANNPLPAAAAFAPAGGGYLYAVSSSGAISRLKPQPAADLPLRADTSMVTVGAPDVLTVDPPARVSGPYSWYHNGVLIAAATGPSYRLNASSESDTGWYTAVVRTSDGVLSSSIWVGAVQRLSRIVNASALSFLGPRGQAQTFGFFVGGVSNDPALVRSIGPSLAAFGMGSLAGRADQGIYVGTLEALFGSIYRGPITVLQAEALVGAFPVIDPASEETALLSAGAARPYTVVHAAETAGTGLTELYLAGDESSGAPVQRIANFSGRAQVGPGLAPLIVGFVIQGRGSIPIVIRALGPGLHSLGLADALADPAVSVYAGSSLVARNDDWTSSVSDAMVSSGAFPLAVGSKDAALVINLPPGVYTAVLDNKGAAGEGMIEVYDVNR